MMTKEELQQKFLLMNRKGCFLKVEDEDGELFTTVLDSVIVLRVNGDIFWVLWRPVWWINGGHEVHAIKMISMNVDDTIIDKHDGEQFLIVEMMDAWERKHTFFLIEPTLDRHANEEWKEWQKYVHDNKADMAESNRMAMEFGNRVAHEED